MECQILDKDTIPIGISNRHVHLSQGDLEALFGKNVNLRIFKELSQPGQYACVETVTLVGPKGVIEKVRVLGPTRDKTQVEISLSDCFKLGVQAPIRDSGKLQGSVGLTLVGPAGAVTINEGTMIAARHIHMHTSDALKLGVKDGDKVNVKTSGQRVMVFLEVLVRVSDKYKLEMHVDIDEANAASLKNGDTVQLINFSDSCFN
ncbi:MAG: phosphate propanoyltransferase [Desulfitibacter sp. BRH_c19]|nr:MAG: phosphate propanoyltransferase [Desulfitibacter sp. BRH_c19]